MKEMTIDILKKKRDSLFSKLKKPSYNLSLKENALLIDEYFIESFELSKTSMKMNLASNPYAIIALGGYGRQEQCVGSDVDVAFLFEKKIPKETEQLVEEIIYPMWQIKLDVGYAIHNLKNVISLAKENIETLTAFLDARFICGASNLYIELLSKIKNEIMKKEKDIILQKIVDLNLGRHEKFGDSANMLEPHLKSGQGGLRDYHTILWLGKIISNCKNLKDLEKEGYLSSDEFERFENSLHFIWNLRNRLHLISNKKNDKLYFEHQLEITKNLNFTKEENWKPVENFLSKLHSCMNFIKEQYLMQMSELGFKKKTKLPKKTKIHDGLELQNYFLQFSSSEAILKNPKLLLEIFEESIRLKTPLSAEAKRLLEQFSYLIYKLDKEDIKNIFEKILVPKTFVFETLMTMINTKILSCIIPEFKTIRNKVQFNQYHIYPVDTHSAMLFQIFAQLHNKELEEENKLCTDIYKGLKNKKILSWAALLHDIGKGSSCDDHAVCGAEIGAKILKDYNYSKKEIELLHFLIKEHLLLIKTASRRDLNDEEIINYIVLKVKNLNTLKMLYLLTAADSMSTGPKAWNEWTKGLLDDLFLKVSKVLSEGISKKSKLEKTSEKIKFIEKIIKNKKEISFYQKEPNLNFLSFRYLSGTKNKKILEHIKLYEKLYKDKSLFTWDLAKNKKIRTLTICTQDQKGLLTKIAAALTLSNINILEADIHTWTNNIAINTFTLNAPQDLIFEDEKWNKLILNLNEILKLEEKEFFDFMDKKLSIKKDKNILKNIKVKLDNTSSSFFSIIEVKSNDFKGLLFKVLKEFLKENLNISFAKIATSLDRVIDIFYVKSFEGEKISQETFITLEDKIKESLKSFT